jgi:hypothetical protein
MRLVPARKHPCPNCSAMIERSYAGMPTNVDANWGWFLPDEFVWTDGVTTLPDSDLSASKSDLPPDREYIARCPVCSSRYPSFFIPWTDENSLPSKNELRFVMVEAPTKQKNSTSEKLEPCSLDENLDYLEFLVTSGLVHTWECWISAQQLILQATNEVRANGELPSGLEDRARASLRSIVESLRAGVEGVFAPRSLPFKSESSSNSGDRNSNSGLPVWLPFANMFRLVGEFELAEQYLGYSRADQRRLIEDAPDTFPYGENNYFRNILEYYEAHNRLIDTLIKSRDASWAACAPIFPDLESLDGAKNQSLSSNQSNFTRNTTVNNLPLNPAVPRQKVFTYYINDPESEVGVFGRVATSEEEVEADLITQGFKDFFLFEVRDLLEEEKPESADFRIKLSPYLGPQWLPIVDAIEELASNPRLQFVQIQTLAKAFNYDPGMSPYIQGLILPEGRFHLEAPKHFFESEGLDQKKLEQMLFIGWNPPGDDESTFNFWRVFDFGWNPRSIAEFALETLTTVFGVTDQDYFDFGSTWQPEVIWAKRQLHRVVIHEGNPKGSIFRLPSKDYPVDSFERPSKSEAPKVEFDDEELGITPHSNRDKYRFLLSQIREHYLGLGAAQILSLIDRAERADSQGKFDDSLEGVKEFFEVESKLDASKFSETFARRSAELAKDLSNLVDSFPNPFGGGRKLVFSELPEGLAKLLIDLVQRVEEKLGEDAAPVVAGAKEYVSGVGTMTQDELQKHMARMLRTLT